jgi:hypothetical protein
MFVFAVVSLALIIPAAWPYLAVHGSGELQRPFSTVEFWSANPTDFIVPNLLHPLWGERLREVVPFQWELWVEKSLYLGVIPVLLAVVALLRGWKERAVRALVGVGLLSSALALGPTLQWAGHRVHLTIPPGLMALLYHLGITPYLSSRLDAALLLDMQLNHYIFIPLPMLFLYLFLPFTTSLRAVGRFGMATTLATAALAGFGLAFAMRARFRQAMRWLLPSAAIAAVLFEFLALPYEMTDLRPRPVDLWLAEQPEGVMVELPVEEGLHPLKDYYSTIHQQATIFGPIAGFIPPTLTERTERLDSFPDQESIEALQEYGTTYILVHTDKYEDWLHRIEPWELSDQLHEIRCFDALCVYGLR